MTHEHLRHIVPEPLEQLAPEPGSPDPAAKPQLWKSIIKILSGVQKYSAYGFLGFFGLHIASTVVVPGLGINAGTSQEIFEMSRNVYLGYLFEPIAVYGAAIVHMASGVALRVCRLASSPRARKENDIIIKDGARDDIGLGGIGTVIGLGFKKSWISLTFPSFTPLTFSGYVMAASLGFHCLKMRLGPMQIDGDSSLVTLHYVTHYLRQSFYGRYGTALNTVMLALLLWVSFYHIVSGLFKYRKQFSLRAKKIAYGVIGTFTALSFISILRLRKWDLEVGFIGDQFAKYLYMK